VLKPEITVIIPCYNGFKHMDRCWDALIHQTYTNFKVIVVDDCSTDDTLEQLYNFRDNSSLDILIIHNGTNQKPAKSRQIGVNAADTEWIAFCDCDDWYEYDFLEKMLNKAKMTNAEMVMCNFNYVYSDGRKKSLSSINRLTDSSTHKEYLAYTPMSLCRFIMKRELYNDVETPSINNAEDGAVTPQLVAKSKKVVSIHECLYNYYIRSDSLSAVPNPNIYKDFIIAQKVINNAIEGQYPLECEFIAIKNICYGAMLNAFKAGVSSEEIRKLYREFLKKYPNWCKNPYISSLDKKKRLFLLLLRIGAYPMLLFYSKTHQYCIFRNF
jgi:glycosyltransferase involved in cell wall biosynthesis